MAEFDFLVIGSGVAGLSYALQIGHHLPDVSIAIITKADDNESNTKYAQGGVAVVVDEDRDSFEKHIQDTLIAGDNLSNPEVVDMVVTQGPKRLNELIQWGVEFDKNNKGRYDLGLEGGHTESRILHHKDITGFEIQQALLEQVHSASNIKILSQHLAIDLISQHQAPRQSQNPEVQTKCFGAYVLDIASNKIETFSAKITMLASGGIGQIYQTTTNPDVSTGDGIGMAYRIGARIENLEFIQFHPTALNDPFRNPAFLISEAVRGFGALLRTKSEDLFMHLYDPRGELASRDIVCRAIDSELKKSGDEFVYLDCRHLDMEEFKAHFPNIDQMMTEIGINLSKEMIPVVPAAHYLCGGISVNEFGQTSVKNLFACGECSNTGLHGANRLASNSLLEALVYAHNSFLRSVELLDDLAFEKNIPDWNQEGTTQPEELILISHNMNELKAIMSDYVGIIRSNERLSRATNRLKVLFEETEELYRRTTISVPLTELRNMIAVAYLIVEQSKTRKENRGGFYNINLIANKNSNIMRECE